MFKVNSNRDRVAYGSLLLPPPGFHVSFAVGTTYSLDLEALTAVCLSLGLSEDTDSSLLQNPITLLNALQKISKKLLVFCESGQIKTQTNPSALSLLLEKIIVPVSLPKDRGSGRFPAFHPKTWLIQYENDSGEYYYRFAVMSRNLTFDRSWDVCFAMDSSKDVRTTRKSKPLVHFLGFLREQVKSTIQNAKDKRNRLRHLIESLTSVSFTTDSKEFGKDFEIMPLGIGDNAYDMTQDPLVCKNPSSADYRFHELVVFSPFLTGSLIDDWNAPERSLRETRRVLVTRKSELSKFTEKQSNNFRIYTLKDDIIDGEDAISDQSENKQKQDIHAKIYLRKKCSDVDLYLGSMNATYSAINKNVEMMIRLRTKNRYYNTESFLKDIFCGNEDNPQNPFEMCEATEDKEDATAETVEQLEQIVKTVCRLPMHASVIKRKENYDITIKVEGDLPKEKIFLTPFRRNSPLPLTRSMCFPQLELLQLSEFYTLKVISGNIEIKRTIMIPTSGIPENRENAIVGNVIKDKQSFMEYVAFVLGDDYVLSLMEDRKLKSSGIWNNKYEYMPALYEKMMKTALESPSRLNDIRDILSIITDEGVVPDKFRALYETFRETLKLR